MKISNKTLYQVLPEITAFNGFLNITLVQQMYTLMQLQRGVGLAANQVGKITRMFVMDIGNHKPRACFNPRVLKTGIITKEGIEGCLSFKGDFIVVDRPVDIDVQYQDINGIVKTESLTDFEARVFLHELDHLNGITMKKRAKINESA